MMSSIAAATSNRAIRSIASFINESRLKISPKPFNLEKNDKFKAFFLRLIELEIVYHMNFKFMWVLFAGESKLIVLIFFQHVKGYFYI